MDKANNFMKRTIIISLILTITISAFAQINTKDISFEFRYPIPIGDNFINKGFNLGYIGIIDLGVDYNIIKSNGLGVGLLLNTSVLKLYKTDITLAVISPKIKVEYEIDLNNVFIIPQIGVGYSNWRFIVPIDFFIDENDISHPTYGYKHTSSENGFTLKGGTKILINNDKRVKWYINLAYEFTRLEKPTNGAENNSFNRNIQLFYPGIGLTWDFGE